ncbi:MAG: S8 family serine peptidase, partial [Lachnospiraceae bacterium]|nr:S8 family serine peptidase [Lachnospiraceae bacterium]
MKKQSMKKIVACTLSALMVFGMIPQGVTAQRVNSLGFINQLDLSKSETVRLGQLKQTIDSIVKSGAANLDQAQKVDLFAPDEKVVVIVDVDTESVMDKFEDSNEKEVQEFIEDNKEVREEVQENVSAVADKVVDKVEDSKGNDEAEVLYSYDTAFTGVAIEVPYGQLETIKKVQGVKNAFVAATYQVPKEQKITSPEIGTNMITSRDLISTGNIQNGELNYTGQGMVIAVLDTGISYRHDAFVTAPVNHSVTVATMADAIANLDLVAEDNFYTATGGTLVADESSVNSIYKSAKVPFGYDYTDNDTEITPIDDENHGTHVSGTIAGNSAIIKGVAPDAQLMGMKVFNDEGNTNDAVLFAALQDALLLDVDVINMSLGSSCGFTVESDAALQEVYDAIEEAGINLDVSAGNSGTSADKNNYGGYSLTKNPSASTVGSPSTLDAALSIASVENTFLNYSHFLLAAGDEKMGYIDNGTPGKEFASIGAGTFEYVNCGLGTPEDVAAAGDLTGKIALVKRGSISFTEKCKNVADAGAMAMVLYNNAAGTISMTIEKYLVPAVSIEETAGNVLVNAINPDTKVGTFTYDPAQTGSLPSPSAGQMSDFSSWGPTPELTLKPEITAPGGNIYSSTQMSGAESQYGLMSGTSM